MQKTEANGILVKVVTKLVEGEYLWLFTNDYSKKVTETELKAAIEEYPGTPTLPSKEAFNDFDFYEISDEEASVDFDLWINDAKSDLTLSFTIKKTLKGYGYRIDNIHVL
jgi:hypothetical protein